MAFLRVPGGKWGWGLVALAAALATLPATPRAQSHGAGSDVIITLKNDFIEQYKDRVTITADFNVDNAGPIHKASKGGNDGDMHFSGRAELVGLPIVAEIMNAKSETPAVNAVRAAQGKDPVKITGAWRLWCEHANTTKQVQGAALEPFTGESNPDHVFEIHPVSHVGDTDTLPSIRRIDHYHYYDANTAFLHYANVKCKIQPNHDGTTTLRTQMAGYNYVEFLLQSLEDPGQQFQVEDGRFLRGNVLDTDGELVARDVRMAFLKDTAPEKAVRSLPKNKQLHVAAIPRIDLALVSWRTKNWNDPHYKADQPLDWNLPYEMIIVGVLNDE